MTESRIYVVKSWLSPDLNPELAMRCCVLEKATSRIFSMETKQLTGGVNLV